MDEGWLIAVPPFLVAVAVFLLPGLAVVLAGWNARSLTPYLFAPAISTAIAAVGANIAPLVGLAWSPVPVAIVTVAAVIVAIALRRWVGAESVPRASVRTMFALVGGLVAAAAIIGAQLTHVFVGPENISQTFDNVVHLNSIRLTLDAADASAFAVGRTSDIGFYPNGWHSAVTLVAQLTGVSVPLAVNTTNLAIGAFVWPTSTMALAAVLFHGRAAALIVSAALSTAFGAFPILLLFFGVLYPNTMAYALLPSGIAGVVLVLHARSGPLRTRAGVLLLVICAAVGLSHPNAFLALFAFGTCVTLWELGCAALRRRDRRTWIVTGSIAVALLTTGAALWRFGRTGSTMSGWGAWQSTAQAFGEAALVAPRGYPITIATALLLLVGLVIIVRGPSQHLLIGIPFGVAAFMFILVSGVPAGTFVRDLVTNPWYNDSYRLAALLPVTGIPVAVLGALSIVDGSRRVLRRLSLPRLVPAAAATVAAVGLFGVGAGANVTATAAAARDAYVLGPGSSLLTEDEWLLLQRLDQTVPEDALIAANPWTGASLAYALAGREVLERHIFGERTEDEMFLDENLHDIDSDPRVCEVVDRLSVTYVLDFGSQNVFNRADSGLERAGLNDLTESAYLVLVDSEGPDARLFRIEGC
ncbi:DUF6541 family protein [Microbacterium sp. 18062]|uniref:DUF6541 family protein n=1 Tax=Microbacterium sp. 18062 TaxID=2681410 RepID=UPI00135A1C33|nr:DUF6541 family protein [Microbacterium sp. 18062]